MSWRVAAMSFLHGLMVLDVFGILFQLLGDRFLDLLVELRLVLLDGQ